MAVGAALCACAPRVTQIARNEAIEPRELTDAQRARDASDDSAQRPARGMVTRRGVCLFRDGARLRLVGSSAFHLHEESVRAQLRWRGSRTSIRDTFDAAERNGVRVLRVAAFDERPDARESIQPAPGALREESLVALDRVIAEAERRDVLLIVVLSNYWDDYGGLPQYLRWLGLRTDYEHRALAMRDPRVETALATYMRAIVTRRNTLTGRAYFDEPSILAWELMNEPRGTNLHDDGRSFASFIHELAEAVKSAGARQLVVAGDEGYDSDPRGYDQRFWNQLDDRLINPSRGESFRRLAEDPLLDAATVHWYPDHWRVDPSIASEGGERWLREHAAIAESADKPLLFEEFGLMAQRHPSLTTRREAYERWFSTAFSLNNVAAAMPWGLQWNPTFQDRDGFEWGARDGDADPYSAIVQRWSARFTADRGTQGCTREERARSERGPTAP